MSSTNDPVCKNCKWFYKDGNQCRRYPPSTVQIRSSDHNRSSGNSVNISRSTHGYVYIDFYTTFTETSPNLWCGEFKDK